MAQKEHVKATYRLSDLIRAQKNDKKINNLSKGIKIGEKRRGPGGGQPQNFEPVLKRTEEVTLPQGGRCSGLQKEG